MNRQILIYEIQINQKTFLRSRLGQRFDQRNNYSQMRLYRLYTWLLLHQINLMVANWYWRKHVYRQFELQHEYRY